MEWIDRSTNGNVGRKIAKDGRVPRADLRALSLSEPHAALETVTGWHHFAMYSGVWALQGSYETKTAAQEAAEAAARAAADPAHGMPILLTANWAIEPYYQPGRRPMQIGCQTEYTTEIISNIFKRMGCRTEVMQLTPV